MKKMKQFKLPALCLPGLYMAGFCFAGCCLIGLTLTQPASACQTESTPQQSKPQQIKSEKSTKAQATKEQGGTLEWKQAESDVIKVGKPGLIQTFRIQRSTTSPSKNSTVTSSIRIQDDRRFQDDGDATQDREVHIEAIEHRLKIPGMNALEIFSKQLPHRYGVHGGQIIVELKKVNQDRKDLAVGFFAPNSWIEASDGRVELLTNQFELATQPAVRYWIGVRCRETKTQASNDQSPRVHLVVDKVVSKGAAERAGIQVEDRIVSWNKQPLNSVEALVSTIQTNQTKTASVQIVRNGDSIDINVTPDMRTVEKSKVQTLIVPAAQLKLAHKKIEDLKKLVERSDPNKSQQLRVLVVGPGVNFGNEEIELRINPEIHAKKAHLQQLLDRVAEKKFGVFVKDNSVTLKKSPEAQNLLDDLDFEPHEIWETMQFGVNGKSISFQQLAPRMIHQATGNIVVTTDNVAKDNLHKWANQLKTGQIVFPNPLTEMKFEMQEAIKKLKQENDRIRELNENLKKELDELRVRLGELKGK